MRVFDCKTVQVSCTYGPSLSPALYINIHVASSLINMTYTQGYTPPPSIIANPNAYIPLQDQVTYTYVTSLSAVLSFPIQNTDVIQGAPPDSTQSEGCMLFIMRCYPHAWKLPETLYKVSEMHSAEDE